MLEIDIYGNDIDEILKKLKLISKREEQSTCTNFNGHLLTSEMSLNECYSLVVGMTKNEYDLKIKEEQERYEYEKKKHKESIPELTYYWIKEGAKYLRTEDLELWNEIVPIRLDDLYRGMELQCLIDIVKILNKSDNLLDIFDEAKKEIDSQDHRGMSFVLICSMIRRFHKHGDEFVEMIK